jgi:hypothetical protein
MDERSLLVVAEIDALTSVDETGDFLRLRELIDRYFALPDAAEHLEVWFRLYERFPDTDAGELFWTILHSIEAQTGWAGFVVASVRRKPAYFPVMMVNRLLNGGIATVGGLDLLSLLQDVAADEQCLSWIGDQAKRFLDYQLSSLDHPLTGARYDVDPGWPEERIHRDTG